MNKPDNSVGCIVAFLFVIGLLILFGFGAILYTLIDLAYENWG